MGNLIETYIFAFLPAIVLAGLIYKADNLKHEPVWLVALSFAAGILAAVIVGVCPSPMEALGIWPMVIGFDGKLHDAFLGKAPVAEAIKLLFMLILFTKNKSFDEYVDGFVYAGAVALGFVGFESVHEIFTAGNNLLAVSIGRAIFSIPIHTLCAGTMGFFFARWKMGKSCLNIVWALATSVLAHVIYDTASLYENTTGTFVTVVALCELCLMALGFLYLAALIRAHRLKDEEMFRSAEEKEAHKIQ